MTDVGSRVLIACDSSEHSEYCIKYYFERIHKPSNQVLFVHVEDIFNNLDHDVSPSAFDRAELEAKKGTSLLKEKAEKLSASAGYTDLKFLVETGKDVWHAIVKTADREMADMIVMGSKGRGLIRRTLIGSVCDSVVNQAHIPVFVIRDVRRRKKSKAIDPREGANK